MKKFGYHYQLPKENVSLDCDFGTNAILGSHCDDRRVITCYQIYQFVCALASSEGPSFLSMHVHLEMSLSYRFCGIILSLVLIGILP